MRYSYLRLLVTHEEEYSEIQHEDSFVHDEYVTSWFKVEEGISVRFELSDSDEYTRSGYIKIPETHQLFNYGVLEGTLWTRKNGMGDKTAPLYRSVENYARTLLKKAGIPMSTGESERYW